MAGTTKLDVVKAEGPDVAWVTHSGRQMVRGPQQSWNTRAAARAQKPKPDNAMGWSVGLEVMPD